MDPVEERRQRAREAAYDEPAWNLATADEVNRIGAAIETATRVQITPEALAAGRAAWSAASGSWTEDPGPRETARLAGSLRALGLDVVE